MIPLWLSVVIGLCGLALMIFALCCAAAAGDRRTERARRDLAGPEDRERVGL